MCNIYTIPAGEPFLQRLAQGLLARHGGDALPELLVLVPNRRSIQDLSDAIAGASGIRAALLPRIRAIGDVDDDDLILDSGPDFEDLEIPPAIDEIERRLLLARLIQSGAAEGLELGGALQLAAELARLIDEVQIFKADFGRLRTLAPERHAAHWQRIVDFLELVSAHWPEILTARGEIDPAERRTRLIEALAARWQAMPPKHPVIVAGSTGSQPATAELMRVVGRLDNGAVILPGLDQWLDDPSWMQLDPGHPQYVLGKLLAKFEIARSDVRIWPPCSQRIAPRAKLLSEALRPAAATDLWQSARDRLQTDLDRALEGMSLLEAAHEAEEAVSIALILREALETPERTACLITQDRTLARRVAAELARWRIDIDDSAGRPLRMTKLGSFITAALESVRDRFAPAGLLALLKHPLSELAPDSIAGMEIDALRGPRPAGGPEGLLAALKGSAAENFARDVVAFLEPLEALAGGRHSLEDWLRAHIAVMENLASASALWNGPDGAAAFEMLERLIEADGVFPEISLEDYAAIIADGLNSVIVRPAFGTHPRLSILGPIEARLHHADLIVLGGLNEESWPAAAVPDPWFSRAMRRDFGLEPPERRIGQSAHDFVSAAAAQRVVLTRSLKSGGTPSVASRWLLRLKTLLAGMRPEDRLASADHILAFAGLIDRPEAIAACLPPAPRPPAAARPKSLSVTEIDRLIRDPYAIYARRILDLKPLDPIDADPGAAERGIILHTVLQEFARAWPGALPVDIAEEFLAVAKRHAGELLTRPGIGALWWPRIERIAAWIAKIEPLLRAEGRIEGIEIKGEITFEIAGSPFRLRARADRIDRRASGLAIIDYKTGAVPTAAEMKAGFSVQLPLEAAIAAAGGFSGLAAAPIAALEILKLSGGYEPGAHCTFSDLDPAALSVSVFEGVKKLLGEFADPGMPYRSRPRVQLMSRSEDFDHLARVREWSAAGAEP